MTREILRELGREIPLQPFPGHGGLLWTVGLNSMQEKAWLEGVEDRAERRSRRRAERAREVAAKARRRMARRAAAVV